MKSPLMGKSQWDPFKSWINRHIEAMRLEAMPPPDRSKYRNEEEFEKKSEEWTDRAVRFDRTLLFGRQEFLLLRVYSDKESDSYLGLAADPVVKAVLISAAVMNAEQCPPEAICQLIARKARALVESVDRGPKTGLQKSGQSDDFRAQLRAGELLLAFLCDVSDVSSSGAPGSVGSLDSKDAWLNFMRLEPSPIRLGKGTGFLLALFEDNVADVMRIFRTHVIGFPPTGEAEFLARSLFNMFTGARARRCACFMRCAGVAETELKLANEDPGWSPERLKGVAKQKALTCRGKYHHISLWKPAEMSLDQFVKRAITGCENQIQAGGLESGMLFSELRNQAEQSPDAPDWYRLEVVTVLMSRCGTCETETAAQVCEAAGCVNGEPFPENRKLHKKEKFIIIEPTFSMLTAHAAPGGVGGSHGESQNGSHEEMDAEISGETDADLDEDRENLNEYQLGRGRGGRPHLSGMQVEGAPFRAFVPVMYWNCDCGNIYLARKCRFRCGAGKTQRVHDQCGFCISPHKGGANARPSLAYCYVKEYRQFVRAMGHKLISQAGDGLSGFAQTVVGMLHELLDSGEFQVMYEGILKQGDWPPTAITRAVTKLASEEEKVGVDEALRVVWPRVRAAAQSILKGMVDGRSTGENEDLTSGGKV